MVGKIVSFFTSPWTVRKIAWTAGGIWLGAGIERGINTMRKGGSAKQTIKAVITGPFGYLSGGSNKLKITRRHKATATDDGRKKPMSKKRRMAISRSMKALHRVKNEAQPAM